MATTPRRFSSARQALDALPDDPHLRQLWLDVSVPAVVTTDPPAPTSRIAAVSDARRPGCRSAGRRSTASAFPARSSACGSPRPGFEPIEGTAVPAGPALPARSGGRRAARHGARGRRPRSAFGSARSASSTTSGSIGSRSPTGSSRRSSIGAATAGASYWREPFVDGGRSRVVGRGDRDDSATPPDSRGRRPGSRERIPTARPSFPVGGVSWYEAAAYAAFAGKSLPTIYHWYRAAALGRFADILTVSNFGGKGPAPVGQLRRRSARSAPTTWPAT